MEQATFRMGRRETSSYNFIGKIMFNTFVINLGYVESTRLSQFIFTHDEGFETVTAGMKSIRSVLVEIAKDEQARKMKRKSASSCCV